MVGTPVSGSPALAKRIRFIHPVEKKLKASYYRVPENSFGGSAKAGFADEYEELRGLAPGDLPGASAATVRSCVQELFSGGRANTQNFCPNRSPDLTFERSTRTRGRRRICLQSIEKKSKADYYSVGSS